MKKEKTNAFSRKKGEDGIKITNIKVFCLFPNSDLPETHMFKMYHSFFIKVQFIDRNT